MLPKEIIILKMTVKSQFLSYLAPFSPSSFKIKTFTLRLAALGMNFSAALMETASPICGAVMEKKIVKMAVTKRAVTVPSDCVTTKPSFPAGVQVSTVNTQGAEPVSAGSICSSSLKSTLRLW